MPKPYRTGAEIRNEERLKELIRNRMEELFVSTDTLLEALFYAQLSGDNEYLRGQIAELQQRKRFLQWIIAMHRPNNPDTVNQYNMVTHGESTTDVGQDS